MRVMNEVIVLIVSVKELLTTKYVDKDKSVITIYHENALSEMYVTVDGMAILSQLRGQPSNASSSMDSNPSHKITVRRFTHPEKVPAGILSIVAGQ